MKRENNRERERVGGDWREGEREEADGESKRGGGCPTRSATREESSTLMMRDISFLSRRRREMARLR
eukprot:scaffold133907_cov25-Tisochrysis_lutea.AAC.1